MSAETERLIALAVAARVDDGQPLLALVAHARKQDEEIERLTRERDEALSYDDLPLAEWPADARDKRHALEIREWAAERDAARAEATALRASLAAAKSALEAVEMAAWQAVAAAEKARSEAEACVVGLVEAVRLARDTDGAVVGGVVLKIGDCEEPSVLMDAPHWHRILAALTDASPLATRVIAEAEQRGEERAAARAQERRDERAVAYFAQAVGGLDRSAVLQAREERDAARKALAALADEAEQYVCGGDTPGLTAAVLSARGLLAEPSPPKTGGGA